MKKMIFKGGDKSFISQYYGKNKVEVFDANGLDCFHDVIFDSTGEDLTQEELILKFSELPNEIKIIAIKWGMNDTVFRDEVYTYFNGKSNPKI